MVYKFFKTFFFLNVYLFVESFISGSQKKKSKLSPQVAYQVYIKTKKEKLIK